MKKASLLILLSLIIQLKSFAQVINNLVVFSNDGEKFTLILNGVRENETPDSRVRVTDLNLKVYEATLLFENKKLKTHTTTLTFNGTNNECVFTLNKHGNKHTMDYVTSTPINQQNTTTTNSTTTNTNTTTTTPINTNTSYTNTNTTNTTSPTTRSTTTTTNTNTSTTTNTTPITGGNEDVAIKTPLGTFDVGNNGIKINSPSYKHGSR